VGIALHDRRSPLLILQYFKVPKTVTADVFKNQVKTFNGDIWVLESAHIDLAMDFIEVQYRQIAARRAIKQYPTERAA